MSIRYVPISINSPGGLQANLSGLQGNISLKPINLLNYPSSSSFIASSNFPVEYLLLALGLALIIFIAILYIRSWYREEPNISILLGEKELYEQRITVVYAYRGLKKILREYFIRFRNKVGCSNCTPRETLGKLGFLKRFVEVYEDVVYGDKQRGDVESVIDEVKKIG